MDSRPRVRHFMVEPSRDMGQPHQNRYTPNHARNVVLIPFRPILFFAGTHSSRCGQPSVPYSPKQAAKEQLQHAWGGIYQIVERLFVPPRFSRRISTGSLFVMVSTRHEVSFGVVHLPAFCHSPNS